MPFIGSSLKNKNKRNFYMVITFVLCAYMVKNIWKTFMRRGKKGDRTFRPLWTVVVDVRIYFWGFTFFYWLVKKKGLPRLSLLKLKKLFHALIFFLNFKEMFINTSFVFWDLHRKKGSWTNDCMGSCSKSGNLFSFLIKMEVVLESECILFLHLVNCLITCVFLIGILITDGFYTKYFW